MKKIKKKLSLKKISIAKVGSANKIIGGTGTNQCDNSFEPDTKPSIATGSCNTPIFTALNCPVTWDCADTIDTCDENGLPI